MEIVISVLAVAYGLVSALAALSQRKDVERRWPMGLMLGGGLALAAAGVMKVFHVGAALPLVVLGAGAVSAAALWNGVKNGEVHPGHHLVRLGLACGLIVGFVYL